MRLSVYRLVHVTGLCIVREHVRGGAYACTQAPRDASTDLRLLPPRIHHHPTDLYISRRVSHFRHYHSCRGCANPWARKRESALGFPPRSFRAGWSRAPTPILSPHVFSPRFSTNGGNASCGAFVSRLVSVRFPRKLVSRTNRSIVNAGIGPRVSFHSFNSLDIWFLSGVERGKEKRERERERVSIAIEVFSLSFLFSFTRGRLVFLGKCVPRVVSPRVHLLLLLNGIRWSARRYVEVFVQFSLFLILSWLFMENLIVWKLERISCQLLWHKIAELTIIVNEVVFRYLETIFTTKFRKKIFYSPARNREINVRKFLIRKRREQKITWSKNERVDEFTMYLRY